MRPIHGRGAITMFEHQGDEKVGAPVDYRADSDDDLTAAGSDVDVPGADDVADAPASGSTQIVQDGPAPSPAQLRIDFGAHLEANYQRLVAQLYAITLDPREAHDVVQDAYSRAWRNWAVISRSPDPSAWIRRVAVRATIRSWRRVLARFGIGRARPTGDGVDARTGAMLAALGRLPAADRRAVVLSHMAGASFGEIAAVEQVSVGTVQARLSRARHVVTEGMADVLPAVLGAAVDEYDADGYSAEGYGAGGQYGDGYSADADDAADEYAADGYAAPGTGSHRTSSDGDYADGYTADGNDAGRYNTGGYDAYGYDNKGEYR